MIEREALAGILELRGFSRSVGADEHFFQHYRETIEPQLQIAYNQGFQAGGAACAHSLGSVRVPVEESRI